MGLGVEDADRKRTWLADADDALARGAVETARAILAAATAALPTKKSVWRKAAELEQKHGTADAVDGLLRKAVTYCPQVREGREEGENGGVDSIFARVLGPPFLLCGRVGKPFLHLPSLPRGPPSYRATSLHDPRLALRLALGRPPAAPRQCVKRGTS